MEVIKDSHWKKWRWRCSRRWVGTDTGWSGGGRRGGDGGGEGLMLKGVEMVVKVEVEEVRDSWWKEWRWR